MTLTRVQHSKPSGANGAGPPLATPLIVVGTHGSGSDVLAEILKASGRRMFTSPPSGDATRAEHAWMEFHQDILWRDCGHDCWITDSPRLKTEDRRRAEALLAMVADETNWGWEDPRTAFFLEFWFERLAGARLLAVIERPAVAVHRLCRVQRINFLNCWWHAKLLACWEHHLRCCVSFAEQHRRQVRLLFVEDLLCGTIKTLDPAWERDASGRASLDCDESLRYLRHLHVPPHSLWGHKFPAPELNRARAYYRELYRRFGARRKEQVA